MEIIVIIKMVIIIQIDSAIKNVKIIMRPLLNYNIIC